MRNFPSISRVLKGPLNFSKGAHLLALASADKCLITRAIPRARLLENSIKFSSIVFLVKKLINRPLNARY